MKPTTIQKEVLVIMNSSFAQRNWCKLEDETGESLSSEEKLEEACVNGLIQDLIPEAFQQRPTTKYFYGKFMLAFPVCSLN